MPIEEYLHRTEKPHCEYLDGMLRPKAMPTTLHAWIQSVLILLLSRQGKLALSELTLPVTPTTYLIPDVTVVARLQLPYPTEPAILCVEIMSPDDDLGATYAKCRNYHAWGVPYCWVVDPVRRTAWEYHKGHERRPIVSTLRAGDIVVSLDELFAGLPQSIE